MEVLKITERPINNFKLVVKPVSIELIGEDGKAVRMLLYDGKMTETIIKLVHSWLDDFGIRKSEEEIKAILSDMISKVHEEVKPHAGIDLSEGDVLIFKATPLLIPFRRELLNLFGKFHEDIYPFSPADDSYSFGATKFIIELADKTKIQIILQFWTLVMKERDTIKNFSWFIRLFYTATSIPLFIFTTESERYLDMYFDFFSIIKDRKKNKLITLFDNF